MKERDRFLTDVKLSEFETIIGYHFKNPELLKQALTHSSYSKEKMAKKGQAVVEDYERLEFLGDAVLELATSRMLFDTYDWPEGKLTRERARIVCESSLSFFARSLGYGDFLVLGFGEEKTGGRDRDSILCDMVESVIGAVYLDGGYEPASSLIQRLIFSRIKEIPDKKVRDHKTLLQEYLQGKGLEAPEYKVAEEIGPPHDRIFVIDLYLEGKKISTAQGKSKKKAEQVAAEEALSVLKQ